MSSLLLHLIDRTGAPGGKTTGGRFRSLTLKQGERQQIQAATTIKRGRQRADEHWVDAQSRADVTRRVFADEWRGEEGKPSVAKHRQEVAGQQAQLQQQRQHKVLQHASEARRKSSDKVGQLGFPVRLFEAEWE